MEKYCHIISSEKHKLLPQIITDIISTLWIILRRISLTLFYRLILFNITEGGMFPMPIEGFSYMTYLKVSRTMLVYIKI